VSLVAPGVITALMAAFSFAAFGMAQSRKGRKFGGRPRQGTSLRAIRIGMARAVAFSSGPPTRNQNGSPMIKTCAREPNPVLLNEFSCSFGEFHISIDAQEGTIRSSHHDALHDPGERDAITLWAFHVLTRCGHPPESPLAVRDVIWG